MKGKIIQFRRGRHSLHERHYLIEIDEISRRSEAEKFVGVEAEWKSPSGKIIKGKISAPHGNKGVVRAIFEKGLPGQAITNDVNILTDNIKTDKTKKESAKNEKHK